RPEHRADGLCALAIPAALRLAGDGGSRHLALRRQLRELGLDLRGDLVGNLAPFGRRQVAQQASGPRRDQSGRLADAALVPDDVVVALAVAYTAELTRSVAEAGDA